MVSPSVRCVDYEALLSCSYIITREHVADSKPSLVTGALTAVLIAKYADLSPAQPKSGSAQLESNYHGCEPSLSTHPRLPLVLHSNVSHTTHEICSSSETIIATIVLVLTCLARNMF